MVTFREYVASTWESLKLSKWEARFHGAFGGTIALIVIAIIFGSVPLIWFHNPLWFLLLTGVPPLALYAGYCDKKADEEDKAND